MPAGEARLGQIMMAEAVADAIDTGHHLLVQAGTGLFSNDESAHEGPLAAKVSEAMVDRMSVIHGWIQLALVVVVALHVAAVLLYQLRLRMDVMRPLLAGAPPRKRGSK